MKNYKELISRKTAQYGEKFDASDLAPQFIPAYESGARITVEMGGMTKRGTIGVTTGWKPCFLLMLRCDSTGSPWTLGKDNKIISK